MICFRLVSNATLLNKFVKFSAEKLFNLSAFMLFISKGC